jgi:hypothetical protein
MRANVVERLRAKTSNIEHRCGRSFRGILRDVQGRQRLAFPAILPQRVRSRGVGWCGSRPLASCRATSVVRGMQDPLEMFGNWLALALATTAGALSV